MISTGAITSHRRAKRANVADPGPEQLLRARRKLSTVTACSSIVAPPVMSAASGGGSDNHNHDVEATAAQLELGEW